jgi:hypothetical protein
MKMAYGEILATLGETENGNELTIRVKLPESGDPARSGRSDNFTDPNEWVEVVDKFGAPTRFQVRLNVVAPYRRAAGFRLRHDRAFFETAGRRPM